jgi:hypothetical protein
MTRDRRAARRKLTLRIGGRRFPIVRHDATTCLIRAPEGVRLRGVADIYEGEDHVAHCLILLAERDDDLIRLSYKWRSPIHAAPPADFAT